MYKQDTTKKPLKYAISSFAASTYSLGCFPYFMMRYSFEKINSKIPLFESIEDRFNETLVKLARSALNKDLVGTHLFDAVELHLTDPRLFYDPVKWKINRRTIKYSRGPISSFHGHMEADPILGRYGFNLSENTERTRKSIRSQLEAAYRIMHEYPDLVVVERPVFVFHPGLARNIADREQASVRTRKNIEYMVDVNNQLYRKYGSDRKLLPTVENSAKDKLSLCQTVDEWKRAIQGIEDEIKLTLDYGHIQTIPGEKDKLLKELQDSTLGDDIVNLHIHYSPEIDNLRRHAHAALSKIPTNRLDDFKRDLRTIVNSTAVREHGYITLEVLSEDPRDYIPSLRPLMRRLLLVNKILRRTGIFDWSPYRGNSNDQLASLNIVRQIIEV